MDNDNKDMGLPAGTDIADWLSRSREEACAIRAELKEEIEWYDAEDVSTYEPNTRQMNKLYEVYAAARELSLKGAGYVRVSHSPFFAPAKDGLHDFRNGYVRLQAPVFNYDKEDLQLWAQLFAYSDAEVFVVPTYSKDMKPEDTDVVVEITIPNVFKKKR